MKRLYAVSFEEEMLVWAVSPEDAEDIAREDFRPGDIEFAVREANPAHHMAERPYGASVTVAALMAAGDTDEDLREARPIAFGDATWWTDGHAAYPALIPGWVAAERREKKDLAEQFAAQIKAVRDGEMPVVAPGLPRVHGEDTFHRLDDGFALDGRYVAPVPPGAIWRWAGKFTAAFAVLENAIVAIVMPIQGRYPEAVMS